MLIQRGRVVTMQTSTLQQMKCRLSISRKVNSSETSTSDQRSFYCLRLQTRLSLPFDQDSVCGMVRAYAPRQTNELTQYLLHAPSCAFVSCCAYIMTSTTDLNTAFIQWITKTSDDLLTG